jgi:low temperature requirement A protein (LtrA)
VSALQRALLPPRLRLQEAGAQPVERHATWTELFFDLVFVVAVAQLASGLRDHLSMDGAIAFVGLFVPVWWTWTTYAYAADLFDADEAAFRAVLLGAMLLVAAPAATVPDAFEGRTVGFVLAYAALRVDLLASTPGRGGATTACAGSSRRTLPASASGSSSGSPRSRCSPRSATGSGRRRSRSTSAPGWWPICAAARCRATARTCPSASGSSR